MRNKNNVLVRNWFGKICVAVFKLFPIKKNRIYFISNNGARYSCNPRAYFEYLYKNHKDEFDFYYCLNHKCELLPKGVKHHSFLSIFDLYYLYTSKYIVNNFRFHIFFAKRKKQIYIQTWHGGPIMYKKFEKDALNLPYFYTKFAKNDAQYIDILCCGSQQAKNVLDNNFYCDNKTVMTGSPRCDKLIIPNKNEKAEILKRLKLDEHDFIVLYAPTFRNKQKVEDSVLENERIKKSFEKVANGREVKILYRFHPNVARKSKRLNLESFVKNVTFYPDIQDLIMVADVLITDYSSCMFDMMLTYKPCIIFTNKPNQFLSQERGVYFPTKDLPFPVANGEDELYAKIEDFDNSFNNYSKKILTFLNNFGCIEDGHACERLYNVMKEYKNE